MLHIADRMENISAETAFEVLARARALEAKGQHIVHLEIGEPDFDTPEHVVKAAHEALDAGETHYGPGAGQPQVRQAVARYLKKYRNLDVDPMRVVVTPGAKPIMFFTILSLVNPGDEVIFPNPSFPIYESMIRFVGGIPVSLPLREELGFRFDTDELKKLVTDKTRLIILNSPHNPTGGVLTKSDLEAVAEICRERDIPVLADEIYGRMVYEGEHHSIAALPGMLDRTILLDGWSKTWAMTGWRLGFGVFPQEMVVHIERLISNSVSCTSSFSQIAGIAALEGPQGPVDEMMDEFRARRELMIDGLNKLAGFNCHTPAGAFYAFPNITGTGFTSKELADKLLYEAGVACLAGTAFGSEGEGYLRLSYANSQENIQIALDRIGNFLKVPA